MVRVAIIDDEKKFTFQFRDIVEEYFQSHEEAYEVKLYHMSTELEWDLEEGEYFDVYLIDVELPGMNGLELAYHIRQRYEEPFIIFITAYMQYSIKGYEYGVFRYITKDSVCENLPVALEAITEKLKNKEETYYVLEKYSKIMRLSCDNIYFVRKEGKYTCFRTREAEYRDRKPLSQVFSELNAREFVYIDKSCVVNLKHVMQLDGNCVVMRGGEYLPVSQPQLQKLKKTISDYWRGRL